MKKFMKIIIIGYGSIGQRHYKNLIELGFRNIFVFDIDRQKTKGLKTVARISEKDLRGFNIAFICNPTYLHIQTAIQASKAGCHLFIEKPLSNTLKDIDKLTEICRKKRLINMVACNYRFHLAIKKIKESLDKKQLGKIYAIYLEYGRYLPYQRPKTDYRKVFAANKKMGGGIILDDIHDFDLLFWFNNFNKIKKFYMAFDTLSNLQIDVEDICNATLIFRNNVLGNIRCDYLQQYKHKEIKIIGEKGNLMWDFRDNIVWFECFANGKENKRKIFVAKEYNINNMYLDEIKYFFKCIEKRCQTFNNISSAVKILYYCVNKS